MSYLVLARKYRPQTFAEIIGQDPVTRTLGNAIAAGRVHHAFLFAGARGVGKTTAARILAKALCCDKGPTATPCGTCEPCTEIRAGSSVDVVEIDGASNRGIDDVRTLRETVRYQPAKYRKRVIIVDEVHMLTTEAFNALLKTLEEPPPHVVFVFATTEPHKIPITILSRCQRYDFKLIPTARLSAHLGEILAREKIATEPEALTILAREAAGSARDALSLCDQVVAFCGTGETITREQVVQALGVADRQLLFAWADAILAKDAEAALRLLDSAHGAGQDVGQLARAFLGHLRDLVVCRAVADPKGLVDAPETELEALVKQAHRLDPALGGALFERFAHAAEEIARSSSPKMMLELALLDLIRAEPLVPLGELVDRLAELEQRSGGGTRAATNTRTDAVTPTATNRPTGTPTDTATPTDTVTDTPTERAKATSGSPSQTWELFLHGVEEQSPAVYATLALAKPVKFGRDAVVLAFSPGSLSLAQGRAEDIQRLVAQALGGPVKVTLAPLEAAGPGSSLSLEESHRQRAEQERAGRRDEARKHPATGAVLDVFDGAELKDIKVDFD